MTVEERPFTLDEAHAAKEAFATAASIFVLPVVSIDGQPVGDGGVGPVARTLRKAYIEEMQRFAI